MKASLFPNLHIELENIVGEAEDVKAGKAIAFISIGSLFSDDKAVSRLIIESAVVPQDALSRVSRWLSPAGKTDNVHVERIEFKRAQLQMNGIELPTFDAALTLASDRSIRAAHVETNDGHFVADILPTEQGVEVSVRGINFALPLGPSLEFTQLSGKGVIAGSQMRITELEYMLYSGQGKGSLTASWVDGWSVEGDFDVQRVDIESAMVGLNVQLTSDGRLAAKGRYLLQSDDLPSLFSVDPRLEASFVLTQAICLG